uniref:PRELI/MSF1 domain-containing protein n=1 Tax=Caenorhabditis japonica TaxID=281687 RepID=A0A8R1DSB9_CAEJA
MKLWDAPRSSFPYSFDEVVSAFWDRYPNSHAKHIISEDVLERKVTDNTIVTKKLIVKQGSSILKRVPRWISRMTDIRVVPVIEESVYDRVSKKLVTYTRNVSHLSLFELHERCVYRPSEDPQHHSPAFLTDVLRSVTVSIDCGRMSSVYEKVLMMGFKKSINNTTKGLFEKLEEKFGVRHLANEKMKMIKDKFIKSSSNLVTHVKCEEESEN